MNSFATWMLRGLSAKQRPSRLLKISNLIDWVPIRRELDEMYDNKSEKGGRPNCDVILMFKILILQQWHFEIARRETSRSNKESIWGRKSIGNNNPERWGHNDGYCICF
jgi:IS5 family transposase